MRKALHVHMLVQLLGFTHPDDLFAGDLLPNTFHRLWHYVASVCFRSTEAFADYLKVPEARDSLQQLPLLHFTRKQRDMIGVERVKESQRAQIAARGLPADTVLDGTAPVSYTHLTLPTILLV